MKTTLVIIALVLGSMASFAGAYETEQMINHLRTNSELSSYYK